MPEAYPAEYLEGLRLFNAEEFFESHEVLEDLWSETQDERRKFYQGLIQASVALLHFGNGNLGGAKKVYLSSRKYLEPFQPRFQGLDVTKLLHDLQYCFQQFIDNTEPCPTGIELLDERVPKIVLPDSAEPA